MRNSGVEQLVAQETHILFVAGSNPVPTNMDIIDYVKITFFPVIYLIKGVKFIFKWFRNKWRDIERSGNFEDKIAFGILYALFFYM